MISLQKNKINIMLKCYNKSKILYLFMGEIMKKLWLFIFFALWLVGCVETQSDTDVIETEIPSNIEEESLPYTQPENYLGYASYIEIDESIPPHDQRQPQKHFNGAYSDITYSALTRELCVTANIIDPQYQRATYYLVGRKQGQSIYGETRMEFLVPSGKGSKKACFTIGNLNDPYEILLTKVDLDDTTPSVTIYSVNTLTVRDLRAAERKFVKKQSVIDLAPSFFLSDEEPYIEFSVSYSDSQRALNKLYIVLMNSTNEDIIEEQIIDINEGNYDGNLLKIEGILFNSSIAPNFTYHIKVYADGHDGVDAFEKLSIGHYSYTTKTYERASLSTSFHGLYAVFTKVDVLGEDVYFYYRYVNNGKSIYTNTKQKPILTVTIIDSKQADLILQTFELNIDNDYFVLPKSLVQEGIYLLIRDSRNLYTFDELLIYDRKVQIYYYPSNEPSDDKTISFYLMNRYQYNLLSLKIEILNQNQEVIETIEDVDASSGLFDYTYTGNYNLEGQYKIRFTYEVDSIIGPMTYIESYPLFG